MDGYEGNQGLLGPETTSAAARRQLIYVRDALLCVALKESRGSVSPSSVSLIARIARCCSRLRDSVVTMGSFWSDNAPEGYIPPRFPSLSWPLSEEPDRLYYLADIVRHTTLWTLSIFILVHLGAAGLALTMHLGKRWSNWNLGAVYRSGPFVMSTWVPFTWGWINVLVLIISSFSIQGGL
ncbi:hypothetical protein RB595_009108 [Gaeumannomyces hyphopodioides]